MTELTKINAFVNISDTTFLIPSVTKLCKFLFLPVCSNVRKSRRNRAGD